MRSIHRKLVPWSASFTQQDFKTARVPAGMEDWYKPDFDDQQWPSGKTPLGTGRFEGHMKKRGRMIPIGFKFANNSDWNEQHEFLLMRASIDLDSSDQEHDLYRVGVLSAGCYMVFVNGELVASRLKDEGFPRYVGQHVDELIALNFKPGRNTIAVISNHYLHKRAKNAHAQIDMRLEGMDAAELESNP
jgi:hypothetical protein